MPKAQGAPAPAVPVRKERNNNFNLLRLVFATLVILSHSSELIDGDNRREPIAQLFDGTTTLSAGLLGVCGFFLLSGYLIVESWERRPQLLPFLIKRVLRIYPAFIVASLVCTFAVPAMVVDMHSYLAAFQMRSYLETLALLLPPPLFYPVFADPFPYLNGAMWSLLYEFRCYLLVAFLGVAQAIRFRWGWLGFTILLAAVSGWPGLPDWAAAHDYNHWTGDLQWFFRLTSLFFLGGSYYLFRQYIPLKDSAAVVALVLTFLLFFLETTYHLGLLTGGAYLLFWAAHREVRWLDPLKRLPDVSYGLYLYGWPVQKLLIQKIPGIEPWQVFSLALPISAVCGYISWHVVEKWFLRLKPRPKVTIGAQSKSDKRHPPSPSGRGQG